MQTILITGCSSGFGLETARTFLDRDWNVIATLRKPREDLLPRSERLRMLALDVTDPESIRHAVESAGPIDVLVNNAGIGMLAALEGTPMTTAREIFETNTLGTIAVTQAVVPQFRQRKAGVIVNVTSSVTLKPHRLLSVYSASKAAVNAFTESLALELAKFNVRVHLVLPGASRETRFGENAQTRMKEGSPAAYAEFTQAVFTEMQQWTDITRPADVAEAIWKVATDASSPPRVVAGADALALSRLLAGQHLTEARRESVN